MIVRAVVWVDVQGRVAVGQADFEQGVEAFAELLHRLPFLSDNFMAFPTIASIVLSTKAEYFRALVGLILTRASTSTW